LNGKYSIKPKVGHTLRTLLCSGISSGLSLGARETGYEDVIMPLIRAHGKDLFLAHGGSIVIEPQEVEDTDVEKLLDVKIH